MLLIYPILFLTMIFCIMIINFFLSKKTLKTREKSSPFECGFDPMNNKRSPFNIHFFLISLIFLIFDIEISMFIPLIYMFMFMNKFMIMSFFLFLLILIMGLYLEYSEMSIDWKLLDIS